MSEAQHVNLYKLEGNPKEMSSIFDTDLQKLRDFERDEGRKLGAIAELDKLLEEFPDRIVYSYVETRKKQLGGKL